MTVRYHLHHPISNFLKYLLPVGKTMDRNTPFVKMYRKFLMSCVLHSKISLYFLLPLDYFPGHLIDSVDLTIGTIK